VFKKETFIGVTLESSGGWSKQNGEQKVKRIQSLVTTDKCLTRTSDMGVKLLENVYKMVCKSRMMYRVEIWGG
jgi:CRISPR/Cas system CMR-associated protein Cmr3 (group 5 of RAMP superfamily)